MNSSFDPEAQAAISELASQLQPALRDVIDTAIREALDKLEDSLQSRREEIEAASGRLEEALNGLGREMKAKAGLALSEGIQEKVIPALEEESRKAAAETSNAMGSRLEIAERTMAGLEVAVRESGGHVSEALERNGRASGAALSEAREEITNTIKKTVESSVQAASAALGHLDERIGTITAWSAESVKQLVTSGFDRSTDAAKVGFSSVQRELSEISEQGAKALSISNSAFGQLDGRLGEIAETFTQQLRSAHSETKKEVITASQQTSAALIREFSNIHQDVSSRMDDIVQQVKLAAEQQRTFAKRSIVSAVILILLSAIIIGLLVHHNQLYKQAKGDMHEPRAQQRNDRG